MKRVDVLIGSALLFGIACAQSAVAADLYGGRTSTSVHAPREAAVVRVPCPDKYSCWPLYGGYAMPYGSPAYWSRYTYGGWSFY